jgi:hypothetical protein
MTTRSTRAHRLIDEFAEGIANGDDRIGAGIARVLEHLAVVYGDAESWYAVPANVLAGLANELRELPVSGQ